jgi:hypothetical protein
VGREAANRLIVADVLLDVVGVEPAVIAVVVRREGRLYVVLGCLDDLGDQRVHAVGADDDSRPLLDRAARAAVTLDARDSIALPEQRLDDEPFPHFRPGLDGSVHEQLVQDRAPRAESAAPGVGIGDAALEGERAHIKEQAERNRGTAGRREAIEQTPPVHDLGAMWPDDVRGNRVAGKCRLVDEQDPIALPGQQHRRRSAGASRADDDRIVHASNVQQRRPRRIGETTHPGKWVVSASQAGRNSLWSKAYVVAAVRDRTSSLVRMLVT